MTEFVSERTAVNAPAADIFNFLTDFTNFQHLMPEQIQNWKADADHCSFTIEGLADLSMRIAGKTPEKNIHIVADGKNPIDYTLDVFLFPGTESSCKVEVAFNADLNPFIKAMASRPLQNFVDLLAQKLREHFA
jgi:carbon monoxide dehydrogenase subunit G